MKISGIYIFRNKIDGKIYVGQSVSVITRRNQHLHLLRGGRHPSSYLQSAFRKYGEDAFEHSIVEACGQDLLTVREQFWMDHFRDRGLYNTVPATGSPVGYKHSPEARAKMSASQKKKAPISEETRERMSRASTGRKQPPSFGKMLSERNRGRIVSQETRARMSAGLKGKPGPNKGVPMPDHVKERLREANLHRIGRPLSAEVKSKISAALKGRVFSEDHLRRMSEGKIGKPNPLRGMPRPAEVGRRISEAKKGRTNGLVGKKLTEEHKLNMRLGQLRRLEKLKSIEP